MIGAVYDWREVPLFDRRMLARKLEKLSERAASRMLDGGSIRDQDLEAIAVLRRKIASIDFLLREAERLDAEDAT